VNFSGHLSEVEELEAPFCPQSLFAQTADLEIEVGSGKGLFVLNESGKTPERNYLGNEVANKYCNFAAYRLAKAERTNAHMLHGDGLKLFRDLQRVLVPDGVFHFWTDVEEYFEQAVGMMKEHSDLSGPHDVEVREAEHDMDYRTHFERRMRKFDHDVFRAEFKKV
jgi:tRNA (guanine-N7-)-methyltransferase